ncbi:MAG: translation initiation factor IF-1 [Candidatus Berkelbacteria bacterium]|nr:translation initiation factor IF-1 [Candidatus Berkelbacteria bacterium]
MTKNDSIEVSGRVLEVLADSKYRIQLESGHTVLGYLSGRMKQHRIQVTTGDLVNVELTPYDLTRGRVVRRLNQNQGPVPKQN